MTTAHTPEQLHQELARAYGERDLDCLIALFEADATLVPQPGQFARGASCSIIRSVAIGPSNAVGW